MFVYQLLYTLFFIVKKIYIIPFTIKNNHIYDTVGIILSYR